MSHNDSWMPLYIGDYLGDTMELDGAQHGAYLLLLMYYWRNGPLPNDHAKLAIIAKTEKKFFAKHIATTVLNFFTLGADGLLHQKRADRELARVGSVSEKRRKAAESRWNGHTEPPPSGSHGDANASANASDLHMQTTMQTPSNPDANDMLSARGLHSHSESKKDSEGLRPSGTGVPKTAAEVLWSEGGKLVRQLLAVDDDRARKFLGTLLKATGCNDHALVLAKLRECDQIRPIDPPSWLIAAVQPFRGKLTKPKYRNGAFTVIENDAARSRDAWAPALKAMAHGH